MREPFLTYLFFKHLSFADSQAFLLMLFFLEPMFLLSLSTTTFFFLSSSFLSHQLSFYNAKYHYSLFRFFLFLRLFSLESLSSSFSLFSFPFVSVGQGESLFLQFTCDTFFLQYSYIRIYIMYLSV